MYYILINIISYVLIWYKADIRSRSGLFWFPGDRLVENTRRLRLVLEALGPAFVKLGQAASCREDILSEVVAAELRKLCDQAANRS